MEGYDAYEIESDCTGLEAARAQTEPARVTQHDLQMINTPLPCLALQLSVPSGQLLVPVVRKVKKRSGLASEQIDCISIRGLAGCILQQSGKPRYILRPQHPASDVGLAVLHVSLMTS
jgi:hypothetical protein